MLVTLLLLGCFPLTLAGRNEASHQGLEDVCDYTDIRSGYWRCGDKCIIFNELCDCGGTTLSYEDFPRHHCCTSTSCTWNWDTLSWERKGVSCPEGRVLGISEPCEDGRCYADYNSSQYLNYYTSHYSCTGDQKDCLPIPHMCQGVSSCGDRQVCNEKLRCVDQYGLNIIRLNTSKVQHSFCQYIDEAGDKSYNSIDRSDENITNTINIKESPMIDYKYLTPCNNTGPEVSCHQTANLSEPPLFLEVQYWCRSEAKSSCVTSQDGNKTATDETFHDCQQTPENENFVFTIFLQEPLRTT